MKSHRPNHAASEVVVGFDLTVEFPAHGMVQDRPIKVEKLNDRWVGSVHDYSALATAFMNRIEPGFRRIRSVLVGWDNSARHKKTKAWCWNTLLLGRFKLG